MPRTMSSDTPDKGRFRIHVDSALNRSPVENARIRIFDTGQPEKLLEEIGTDTNGNSETVELPAPPLEYSMEPGENQPFRRRLPRLCGKRGISHAGPGGRRHHENSKKLF